MAQHDSDHSPSGSRASVFHQAAKAVLRPLVAVFAVLYFLIDALFYWLVKPIADRFGHLAIFARLGAWVRSLGPYPTLALFLVPVILLEPVKPVALYLFGAGHLMAGTIVLVVGEILKITIVERLFHLGRDKLMTIAAFAFAYDFVMRWISYLHALPPWQAVLRHFRTIKARVRRIGAAARRMTAEVRRRLLAFWADPA